MCVCVSNLVAVADIGVRQRAGHKLEQHHAVAVHIRLEGVRVRVLHADHLRSLEEKDQDQLSALISMCSSLYFQILKLVCLNAHHPQYGSAGLFHLLRAAPARLHRGQAEVTDLHRPTLVQEDI